ncbi:MAG: hypothetical protein NTX59_02585 [Elusimicrobia bacterium]|nr:hypothetical protein [Elusimicrobiota bacterium]
MMKNNYHYNPGSKVHLSPLVYFVYGSGRNFRPGLQVICRYLAKIAGVEPKIKCDWTLAYLKQVFICVFTGIFGDFERNYKEWDCLVLSDYGKDGSDWSLIRKVLRSFRMPVWQNMRKLVLIELSGADHSPLMPFYLKTLALPLAPRIGRVRALYQLELFNRADAVSCWNPRQSLETLLKFRSDITAKECRAYPNIN